MYYITNVDSSKSFGNVRENVCSRRCIYDEELKHRIYTADIELYEELQD